MKIYLSAIESRLASAWEQHCGALPGVTIHQGSIIDLKVDAVVSPANSFGFMDGGIDHVYSHHFGWHVTERLQEVIRERHHGELLVGTADMVETDDPRIPYLIAAPTMRVPQRLTDSVNPYLAARAVFLLIQNERIVDGHHAGTKISDLVTSVAFPGLGTGVGGIGFDVCAQQVAAAIQDVVMGQYEYPTSWADAQIRHQKLYTDRIRDLQRE